MIRESTEPGTPLTKVRERLSDHDSRFTIYAVAGRMRPALGAYTPPGSSPGCRSLRGVYGLPGIFFSASSSRSMPSPGAVGSSM